MNPRIASVSNSPLEAWISQDDCRDDFNARLAAQTIIPSAESQHITFDSLPAFRYESEQSSTAVHAQSEYDLDSMASDNVPALTRGNSIASASSSRGGYLASVIDGGCVLTSEDGVLTIPARYRPDSNLHCPFQILECHEMFSNPSEFKTHVFSHFRGHQLPDYAPCFVCNTPYIVGLNGDDAFSIWNQLLDHMVQDHYRGGDRVLSLRPVVAVLRYMWDRAIITDAEYTAVQSFCPESFTVSGTVNRGGLVQIPEVPMAPPAPVPFRIRQELRRQNQAGELNGRPYTVFAGRRQERRQAERLRVMTRV